MPQTQRRNSKAVNLALQGGGSHGAFTWGVLDKLLEDGRIYFEAISGTSAGAMNAVVLAYGLIKGDNEGAREKLEDYWRSVAIAGTASPMQRDIFSRLRGDWSLDHSPGYLMFDLMSRVASPYDLDPLGLDSNPLRPLLEQHVDFDMVRQCPITKLFISATNVYTGRVRVFRTDEITLEATLASACLPKMFQAIMIDGEPYWDGGYMGNPAMFPFFDNCASNDVLLIQINPMERREIPKTARDIDNRLNEITFNASLLKELRAIEFVSRLIDDGRLDPNEYKHVNLHRIESGDRLKHMSASSKMNAEWEFLTHLRDIGRERAELWLEECFPDVGIRATVDIWNLLGGVPRGHASPATPVPGAKN